MSDTIPDQSGTHEWIVFDTLLVASAIISLFLNTFVAWVIPKVSRGITPANLLYVTLLLSDVAFTIVNIIIQLLSNMFLASGKADPLANSSAYCQAVGIVAQFFASWSMSLMFLQLANPYRIIILEKQSFTNQQISNCMFLISLFLVIIACLPLISGDEYKIMPSGYWCYAHFDHPKWGTLVMVCMILFLSVILPIAFMVGYTRIWLKMKHDAELKPHDRMKKTKHLQWLVLQQGIAVILVYSFCWSYPTFIIGGQVFGKWAVSREQDLAVLTIAMSAPILNPILLLCINEKLRSAAKMTIHSMVTLLRRGYRVPMTPMDEEAEDDEDVVETNDTRLEDAKKHQEAAGPLQKPSKIVLTTALLKPQDSTTEIMSEALARRC